MGIKLKEVEQEHDFNFFKITSGEKDEVLDKLNEIPIVFITNAGQINSKVKYYTKGQDSTFFFTQGEVVLSFVPGKNKNSNESDLSNEDGIGVALSLHFIDANSDDIPTLFCIVFLKLI